jgi:F0F1-type ATP synthase assembly protein I
MNPVFWGLVVVLLLGFLAVVTMGKTKWKRSELDAQAGGLPGNKGRVSGGDD